MEIISPKKCTGCGACMAVCSAKAIEMKIAEDGFRYPRVNDQLCTRCGQCVKICRSQENGRTPLQAYAALGHHAALVERSASGGVFATLAHQCVEKGGMVAGVVLERTADGFQVFHAIAEKPEALTAMQGSKYVQSDAWRCYPAILEALNSGNTVLFSGTPCQVSAVKRLTGNPDNLITMDLICHGVPSGTMLNQYARILGRRLGGRLNHIRFRDKSCKKSFCAEIGLMRFGKVHTYRLSSSLMSFYRLFLKGSIYRSSCYTCPYAKQQRVGDLTIGDYWGVEEKHAEDFASGRMEKRSDWSCVLVNSEKGAAFLQSCADDLSLIPSRVEWVAAKNQQLNAPSPEPPEREIMMHDYQRHGYGALERAFVKESGGWLKYRWRMLKNLRQNQKRSLENKG